MDSGLLAGELVLCTSSADSCFELDVVELVAAGLILILRSPSVGFTSSCEKGLGNFAPVGATFSGLEIVGCCSAWSDLSEMSTCAAEGVGPDGDAEALLWA